jgi:hypothetical protein
MRDDVSPLEDIDGFPPTHREVTIDSISLLILERHGSPPDSHSLTLEIRDYSGQIKHTVSVSVIDLLTVPVKEWIPVKISSSQRNLIISPGEYLAIRSNISGPPESPDIRGPSDEPVFWEVYPAFEVIVRDTGN